MHIIFILTIHYLTIFNSFLFNKILMMPNFSEGEKFITPNQSKAHLSSSLIDTAANDFICENYNSGHFDSKPLWRHIIYCVTKMISYLQDSRVGEELKEVMIFSKNNDSENIHQSQIELIINVIDRALTENPTERTNMIFLQLYRLSAIYLFSRGNQTKSFEIIHKCIKAIDQELAQDKEKDLNLLVEKDKLQINLAQFHFWNGNFSESGQILTNKTNAYLQKRSINDDIYSIKIVHYIGCAFTYLAWIELAEKEKAKREKIENLKKSGKTEINIDDDPKLDAISYINSALTLLKGTKEEIFKTFSKPDFQEIYRRQIKLYHQYFKILAYKYQDSHNPNPLFDFDNSECIYLAYEKIIEIIKIASLSDFEFDEELPRHQMIYYYLVAAYLSLNIENQEDKTIDLEQTLTLLCHAMIENNILDFAFKLDFKDKVINLIIMVLNVMFSNNHVTMKQNTNNVEYEQGNVSKSLLQIDKKLIELISLYDRRELNIGSTKFQSLMILFQTNLDLIKNMALKNEGIHSELSGNQEIHFFEYICKHFLFVLKNLIIYHKETFPVFNDDLFVLESLNGYLIIDQNLIKLVNITSLEKKSEELESNDDNAIIAYLEESPLFRDIKQKKSEKLDVCTYYHCFEIEKSSTYDLKTLIIAVSIFYNWKLYKPCIVILNSIISQFIELIEYFTGSHQCGDSFGFLNLHLFFTFLLTKIYLEIGEYDLAIKELNVLDDMEHYSHSSYSSIIYYVLIGICLTKRRFTDLGATYFQIAQDSLQELFDNDAQKDDKKSLLSQEKPESDDEKETKRLNNNTLQDFIQPVKILRYTLNLMKIKALNLFQAEVVNLKKRCFLCKKKNEQDVSYCHRCRRAYYCSMTCHKKDKYNHVKICSKYYAHYQKLNEVLTKLETNKDNMNII